MHANRYNERVEKSKHLSGPKNETWVGLAIFAGGLLLGLLLTVRGFIAWDDWEHLRQSRWLIWTYGLVRDMGPEPSDTLKWYGPMWEIVMGLFSFVILPFLKDPLWVRHAVTFALFPFTLWAIQRLLRRAGVERGTAWLASALVFGCIRYGGHAVANTKDFPFASAFLLATLWMWPTLRRLYADPMREIPWRGLAGLSFVAILPYLFRPPVALHFAILCAWNTAYLILIDRASRPLGKLGRILLVPAVATAAILVFHPAVLHFGVGAWVDSMLKFGKYTAWIGPVTFWGRTVLSNELPRWYAFSWLPVILNPLAFVALLAGLIGLAIKTPRLGDAFPLRIAGRTWNFSLKFWLVMIVAASWASVVVMHPVLYDEERHLLFLFPPLLVGAALGLDFLSPRAKTGLTVCLVLASLLSYARWTRYSYVYKSPIIGDTSGAAFMGDYWGMCVTPLIAELKGKVPPDSEITIVGPGGIGQLALDRLNEGLFTKEEGFAGFRYQEPQRIGRPAVVIAINRRLINGYDMMADLKRGVAAGQMIPVKSLEMPPGEDACFAVLLPRPQ